jgi:hypothetical protein
MAGEEDFLGESVDDTLFLDSKPLSKAPRRVTVRRLIILAIAAAAIAGIAGYAVGQVSAG